jgi:hypothetical protein
MTRLVIGLVLLCLVSAAWVFGMSKMYDDRSFVSAETKEVIAKTLMVTDEHRQELNRSARITDEFAFGLLGLLAGAVIATCSGRFSNQSSLTKAGIFGAVLGGLAGAVAGYIGHAFQANVSLVENSTVHAVLRLIAMFLPFAIAMGAATAISGDFKRDVSDTMVSAIMGLLIGATIYGLASDAIPGAREQETQIMPLHLQNRILLVTVLTMLTSLMIAGQMLRKPKEAAVAETA